MCGSRKATAIATLLSGKASCFCNSNEKQQDRTRRRCVSLKAGLQSTINDGASIGWVADFSVRGGGDTTSVRGAGERMRRITRTYTPPRAALTGEPATFVSLKRCYSARGPTGVHHPCVEAGATATLMALQTAAERPRGRGDRIAVATACVVRKMLISKRLRA
jgi:hypothetical protein